MKIEQGKLCKFKGEPNSPVFLIADDDDSAIAISAGRLKEVDSDDSYIYYDIGDTIFYDDDADYLVELKQKIKLVDYYTEEE
jgi:hypothetical protein